MSGPDRDPYDDAWRTRLAALAGDEPANPEAERRTVEELRRTGYLDPRRKFGRLSRAMLQIAAGVILLLGGMWLGRQSSSETDSPRFALFLLEDSTFQGTRSVGHDSLVAEYSAWAGNLAQQGKLVLGEELGNQAWPLGRSGGTGRDMAQTITGFFVLTARGEAEALAIARSCPHLRYGGGIVVRPIQPTS